MSLKSINRKAIHKMLANPKTPIGLRRYWEKKLKGGR